VKPAIPPARTVAGNYPRQRRISLKYADQDPSGGVNGIAIGRFFEEARFTVRSALDAPEARDPDIRFVLARVRIDILEPVWYPGTVDVCMGVAGVGRTSFSSAAALFQDGRLVAVSDSTVAVRDGRTGEGCVLSPEFHRALIPMLVSAHEPSVAR
jgi:acyl-CoA thioester hydrolase